jgi:glucose uptake protein
MTLPQTYAGALALMILSMICWGSWANTFKATRKWRFELYYFDYAFGVAVASVIYAFTAGNLGFDGLMFFDDLMHSGKRQWFFGFMGGVVFNLANMLLVAAISVAGMAVAFPVGIGMALVIGVVWNYFLNPQGNPVLLFSGCAVIAAAIVVDAMAYRSLARARQVEQVKAGKTKSTMIRVPMKGIVVSIASGLLMGSFFPLVEMGKAGEVGLGPYAIGFVFAGGVFFSTFVFNLFFMNLPIQGSPVEPLDYFRGGWREHGLGWLGGIIWYSGAICNFVAASSPEEVQVGPAISYAIGQGATMVSALWGLLLWKEFAGADARVKSLLVVMFALFLTGLGLVSVAPLYVR